VATSGEEWQGRTAVSSVPVSFFSRTRLLVHSSSREPSTTIFGVYLRAFSVGACECVRALHCCKSAAHWPDARLHRMARVTSGARLLYCALFLRVAPCIAVCAVRHAVLRCGCIGRYVVLRTSRTTWFSWLCVRERYLSVRMRVRACACVRVRLCVRV
jgi:hypothetical protein